jgi:hypothetical protein
MISESEVACRFYLKNVTFLTSLLFLIVWFYRVEGRRVRSFEENYQISQKFKFWEAHSYSIIS